MKKILSLITLLLIIVGFIPQNVEAMSDTGYFVVTAYYSPLPNQKHYLTGNYESEIRLNWSGIRWASWKWVFSGMLAWPKTYAFWTKVYLEWLGIWEISDRWGAIVTAWNRGYSHDRLDVWVGYGDEWLQRALYWGKRTVKWNIIDSNSIVTLDYTKLLSPNWATSWLKPKEDVFTYSLWVDSDSNRVKKLQQFLKDLWLYTWEINWVYNDEIISIVYNFQIDNEILSSKNDAWAGYWGNITRDKFKKAYLNWEFDDIKIQKIEVKQEVKAEVKPIEVKQEIKQTPVIINTEVKKENDKLEIFNLPLSWLENTKKLQSILKELSIYNGELTWNYNDITDSIYNFQLTEWIVKNVWDAWAWFYGPKTREALKNKYLNYKKQLEEAEKVKQEEEKRRKELEDKYREIEKIALQKVETKTKNIYWVKFWDISPNVRNLQVSLKELGYFNDNDTAIFWEKTKEAVIKFQLSNNLIENENSIYAWILWERTLNLIKTQLTSVYLKQELALNKDLDLSKLLSYLPNLKI